jgi:hypothetical protein
MSETPKPLRVGDVVDAVLPVANTATTLFALLKLIVDSSAGNHAFFTTLVGEEDAPAFLASLQEIKQHAQAALDKAKILCDTLRKKSQCYPPSDKIPDAQLVFKKQQLPKLNELQ